MRDAVIVSIVRTAIGRAINGTLRNTRPEYTASEVVKEAVRRAGGLEAGEIDDLVMGCSFPEAEAGMNFGRIVALKAGLSSRVPGMTVNRYCASGLEAIAIASQKVMCGFADVVVAAGAEHMSLIPMGGNKPMPDPDLVAAWPEAYITMGLTAENVAQRFNISRQDQDAFALESQRKAARAQADGSFRGQILPLPVTERGVEDGKAFVREKVFEKDECIRPDSTLEGLSRLRALFRGGGTVTAGNSCPMNDGAAAAVIMSRERAGQLKLRPMAVFRSMGVAGVDPEIMGVGPVAAVPKALACAGIGLDRVDLFELNEAFASQSIYVVRQLGLDPARLNVNGGSIALGHPLGCTGVYLTAKLLNEMERRRSRFGVVTMCVGGGMGAAAVFEREP